MGIPRTGGHAHDGAQKLTREVEGAVAGVRETGATATAEREGQRGGVQLGDEAAFTDSGIPGDHGDPLVLVSAHESEELLENGEVGIAAHHGCGKARDPAQ